METTTVNDTDSEYLGGNGSFANRVCEIDVSDNGIIIHVWKKGKTPIYLMKYLIEPMKGGKSKKIDEKLTLENVSDCVV